MQRVTRLPYEVTAVRAVIGFEMPDDGLDGLTPLEQLSLMRAPALGLAPVHDADIRFAVRPTSPGSPDPQTLGSWPTRARRLRRCGLRQQRFGALFALQLAELD